MQLDAKQQVVQKDAKCQWYSCMSDDQENEPQTKILSGLEQSSEIHASVSNNKVLKNAGKVNEYKNYISIEEKTEDEFISRLRLESLVWATYVNYIILALSIIFIYDEVFFWVMILNMFTILLFFLLRFNWILSRTKKQMAHEE